MPQTLSGVSSEKRSQLRSVSNSTYIPLTLLTVRVRESINILRETESVSALALVRCAVLSAQSKQPAYARERQSGKTVNWFLSASRGTALGRTDANHRFAPC